mmetsp:Transcript_12506/g.13711  ORF Transcript_12506/g.13711 Transcript_12506/m.13711 type:complete len:370 (-) Transcript_12506:187-1296(-)
MYKVEFKVPYQTDFGQNVYVIGNIPELGNWKVAGAVKLKWHDGHIWKTIVPISSRKFEYKYMVTDHQDFTRWEIGDNRPAEVLGERNELFLDDHWDHYVVYFSIFYALKKPTQRMCMTGDLPEIGSWFKPGPVDLELGKERKLLTGAIERVWEKKILVKTTVESFQYRYLIYDEGTKTSLWEREPNRKATIAQRVNGVVDTYDHNFVAGMAFDAVPPKMFVGPYPQNIDHIDELKEAGVTAVFNVQTEEDFVHRQVDWPKMKAHYEKLGIKLVHYPIRDFNPEDLRAKLPRAADLLDGLISQDHQVYIHCTAGMGRASASCVMYLCVFEGYELDDAIAYVKKHRPVVVPNRAALELALEDYLNAYVDKL